MIQSNNVQFAEVCATLKRADGRVENLGVLASYEAPWHRLRRYARRVLSLVGLVTLAYAATREPAALTALPAATVITDVGQSIVTNRMIGAGTEPLFIAWGTGPGTTTTADTALFAESTEEARVTGTSSRVTTTVPNDTYQVVGQLTVATSPKTITNVALFDATTGGAMYFKSDFPGLPLQVGDAINFTIKVKFSFLP